MVVMTLMAMALVFGFWFCRFSSSSTHLHSHTYIATRPYTLASSLLTTPHDDAIATENRRDGMGFDAAGRPEGNITMSSIATRQRAHRSHSCDGAFVLYPAHIR